MAEGPHVILLHLKGGSKVLIKVQKGIAFVFGMAILLTLTACQQNEPKEKDGKLLLTVCMESTSGLPGSAEKGTTMENSIREIARYFETEISPDVTFEFVCLPYTPEERAELIDQLQVEMMAGKGPDIFILPCNDGFSYNETQLFENVEKSMNANLFADISTQYDQDETLEHDLLLEKVMDAGVADGKRYILPLRYQYPIILVLESEMEKSKLDIDALGTSPEQFLDSVMSLESGAWQVSGASVFAANFFSAFSNVCDYGTGETFLDEENLAELLSRYGSLLATLKAESIQEDGTVWPYYLSDKHPMDTVPLCNRLFSFLDIASAQGQELVAIPFAAQDGSIIANVSYYGAISANCSAVGEAYDFLRLFLSREVQSGGRLTGDAGNYDASECNTVYGWPVRSDISAADLRQSVPQMLLADGTNPDQQPDAPEGPAPMLEEGFFTSAYERIGEVRPFSHMDGEFSRQAMGLYDFSTYTSRTEQVPKVTEGLLHELETEVAE